MSENILASGQFRQLSLIVGSVLAVFISFGIVLVAVPLYVRYGLGRDAGDVGITFGIASVGAVVVGPLAGRLADRYGRRRVLFTSLGVLFGGYLSLSLQPTFAVVLAVRLVAGAFEAAAAGALYTIATDLLGSNRRGEAISVVTTGSYLGLAGGPFLGDLLIRHSGFSTVWLAAAGAILAAALFALLLGQVAHPQREAPRAWLPPRSAVAPGMALFLAFLGWGGFSAFAILWAREVGLEPHGVVFIVLGVVVIMVRGLGRHIPDRLGGTKAGSIACGAIVLGLGLIALFSSPIGLLIGTAIFAVGQALAYPSITLLAMARASADEQSAAVGALLGFVDAALAGGAFVLGLAADALGYRAVFVMGAGSAVAALILLRINKEGTAVAPTRAGP
jgi:predicted MFS family arabinose efflux permease